MYSLKRVGGGVDCTLLLLLLLLLQVWLSITGLKGGRWHWPDTIRNRWVLFAFPHQWNPLSLGTATRWDRLRWLNNQVLIISENKDQCITPFVSLPEAPWVTLQQGARTWGRWGSMSIWECKWHNLTTKDGKFWGEEPPMSSNGDCCQLQKSSPSVCLEPGKVYFEESPIEISNPSSA